MTVLDITQLQFSLMQLWNKWGVDKTACWFSKRRAASGIAFYFAMKRQYLCCIRLNFNDFYEASHLRVSTVYNIRFRQVYYVFSFSGLTICYEHIWNRGLCCSVFVFTCSTCIWLKLFFFKRIHIPSTTIHLTSMQTQINISH